jgi:hypothetical protein
MNMGLDQYAFARKGTGDSLQADLDDGNGFEIQYWRKHANLEGWMSDLYKSRGGEGEFNCVELQLFDEDIAELEKVHATLETSIGFFWGQTYPEHVEETQAFIDKAKEALANGYKIIYTSWW